MNAPAPAEPQAQFADGESDDACRSLPMSVIAKGDRRLDAEAYLTGGYGLRVQVEASVPFLPLGDLAAAWQPYRLKGTLVGPGEGVPFLTATQVFDIRPVARKWVAPGKTPHLDRRFVESGWLLVTCSGSVGDAIMAFEPHLGVVISHDLLRIQARDPSHRGYLYTYFRSRFGRTMLRSSKYGSIIKHLEPEHIADLPIPVVPKALYDEMDSRIARVFDLRGRAFRLITEAECLYADQFPTVQAQDVEGYSVRAGLMFTGRRRLDAARFTPTAREIEASLFASPTGKVDVLADVVERVVLPNRFKRTYVDRDGIPFLDSEDVFKISPEITKYIAPGSRKDLDKYIVKRGWLLLARSGQTYGMNGSVMLANGWHENKIISEHIIRIVPRPTIRSGYLAMALGHPTLGRPLMLRLAYGASVPEIAPGDVKSFPVARLGPAEEEIADRVEAASDLRMEADQEEDAAVACLEADLEGKLLGTAVEHGISTG